MLNKYFNNVLEKKQNFVLPTALNDDEKFRKIVMKSLEELKKQRDKLDHKIFIAETLAVAFGMDLFEPDEELDESSAAALNEVIRECIWKNAATKED